MQDMKMMRERRWAGHGDWPIGHRKCLGCGEIKPLDEFHKQKNCVGGRNSRCKDCRRAQSAVSYARETPEYRLFYRARRRARQKGIVFTLRPEDISIPSLCPVLEVPMVAGTETAPSLDRLVPESGYVPENVRVISKRANTIKNNATAAEIAAVAKYLAREGLA